jgi:oxygen-independent coproporphyrinogen III oxidase
VAALAVAAAVIGVYVHVPFCRTLCPYCDFVRTPVAGAPPAAWLEALATEIETSDAPRDAGSVFFGGGTPSLLDPDTLGDALDHIKRRFDLLDAEITIEANPDDVSASLAAAWRDLGVNRVSLGVQSFNDDALRYLGRRHDARKAREACRIVAGIFENWSMDLICGAHPADALDATLEACMDARPAHVSAYGLTYEPGTPFGDRTAEALDDDRALAMFDRTHDVLTGAGYRHYEISNYALPGKECRHNLIYWRNAEYAGFGPGAYSFLHGERRRNTDDIGAWLAGNTGPAERLRLSSGEVRVETLIQHFRLDDGIVPEAYRARFGRDLLDDFGERLRVPLERGLLVIADGRVRPTREGFRLNNEIGLALVG